jgi:hypothetical protein
MNMLHKGHVILGGHNQKYTSVIALEVVQMSEDYTYVQWEIESSRWRGM